MTVIRDVRAAIQVSIVQFSRLGVVPLGWSEVETKSKPSASARWAAAPGSVVVAGTSRPNLIMTFLPEG